MKRGRRILLMVVACGVVTGAVAVLWPGEREPEYQGKKLSAWTKLYRSATSKGPGGPEAVEAAEAIRAIGTNGIPVLLRWLGRTQPVWRERLGEAARRLPGALGRSGVLNVWVAGRQPDCVMDALAGFQVLGSSGRSAVPVLGKRVATGDWRAAQTSANALAQVGEDAVGCLLGVVANGQALNREIAANCVAAVAPRVGTNAAAVAAVLAPYVKDTNADVATCVAAALGKLVAAAQVVVPALTNGLSHPSSDVRTCSALSLVGFGRGARAAVPSLVAALEDSSVAVREAATNALQTIAPEVLEETARR